MDYTLNWTLQDGKLDFQTGRIVVFGDQGIKSRGPSLDHNDLIAAFSRRNGLDRSVVMSKAYRFYWKPTNSKVITISPVRKLDEEYVLDNVERFDNIIDDIFDKDSR
ncbi:MAG: hypothetical protein FWB83_03345 [Treponema sp.]|nr:hypothetical protein [Treponema sp.]